jgi:hypothetical protein
MYEDKREPLATFQRHKRRSLYVSTAFVLALAIPIPFLAGFPLHKYWDTIGKFILLFCMGLLVVLVWQLGTTWVIWQYLRDIEKIEEH